ncbi:MAG TPA: universal stress protein [Acidothermaceae bacterium]
MTTCHDTSSWGSVIEVDKTQFHRIVVGVDGSANSIAALQLAVGLAAREGATLEAVYAYNPYVAAQYPFAGALPPYGLHGEGTQDSADPTAEPINAATDSLELLTSTLNSVLAKAEVDEIVARVAEGDPHHVLASAADHADLLVVGARGHDGPLGLLHGSTAQACTRHATCPVLVVPARY